MRHRISADYLLQLMTLLMTVLGGTVSAIAPTSPLHKGIWAVVFVSIGICTYSLAVIQSRQAKENADELRSRMNELREASAATAKLQAANNELQRQRLELSERNAELAREAIHSVTGGDSFCWMQMNFQFGYPTPMFVHSGKHTLYEINVRVANLNLFREKVAKGQQIGIADDVKFSLQELQVN